MILDAEMSCRLLYETVVMAGCGWFLGDHYDNTQLIISMHHGVQGICFFKQREESSTETGPSAFLIFNILIPTVLTCGSGVVQKGSMKKMPTLHWFKFVPYLSDSSLLCKPISHVLYF